MMNFNLTNEAENSMKLNYPVLIEAIETGEYRATILGWPECQAIGKNRDQALIQLRQIVTARLEKAEIVSLEIERPKPEHPWMKFAGMFKDDPDFDEVQAFIEEDRRQLDAEMEVYYRQLDAEEKIK
ncbi:type II toxin-antitoxin system HicB family antitoxin [Okeania sp. SIO1I7]|uniref:type II toxin-antitoxin system HicB family antitoxin n=1 Tax=Okeania sp. SIO1I7 TaxID=2607772 RepID=UPI0026006B4E|nr:type II toxin-antitoxin system HicB family antitoxin [Okeania sp. SIO1I7]